ncbi:hypothetical protein EHJ37_19670 [Vibrio parahaemolyticus]|nr:hypothetical protein [Vibrio parahaemolyticus]
MARPKSYTDKDVIEAAKSLVKAGVEPSGWRIREIFGRGKISAIQSDLDRLIESGEIVLATEKKQEVAETEGESEQVHAELPLEILDAYKLIESDLSQALMNIVVRMNDASHAHHEQLTRARLKEATSATEAAIEAKAKAEEEVARILNSSNDAIDKLETELEELYGRIDQFEIQVSDLNESKSELSMTNGKLEAAINTIAEKLQQVEAENESLKQQLSESNKANTVLDTELKTALKANDKMESQVTTLTTKLEQSTSDLSEAKTELKASEKQNKKLETQVTALTTKLEKSGTELSDAKIDVKASAKALADAEGQVKSLTASNTELSAKVMSLESLQTDSKAQVKQLQEEIEQLKAGVVNE